MPSVVRGGLWSQWQIPSQADSSSESSTKAAALLANRPRRIGQAERVIAHICIYAENNALIALSQAAPHRVLPTHSRASKSMRGSTTVYSVSPTICISRPSKVKMYNVPNITG